MGIPQELLLLSILYLFNFTDLLEIFDREASCIKTKQFKRFIDNTLIVVRGQMVQSNIEEYSQIIPQLLEWAQRHTCQFDILKF